jgi:hypothetical protein
VLEILVWRVAAQLVRSFYFQIDIGSGALFFVLRVGESRKWRSVFLFVAPIELST